MTCHLSLENLLIAVKLGVTALERDLPQMVSLDIKLSFLDFPLACQTDNINDAICYQKLATDIQKFCTEKSFCLIEAFGLQLYQFLKENFPKEIDISLRIIKKPPISNLEKSVFTIGNF